LGQIPWGKERSASLDRYFCGTKCRIIGKHAHWPTNGYDLCAECATEWKEHGRADFLLEHGIPRQIFRIDDCVVNDTDNKRYKGSVIFFERALAFLAHQKEGTSDWSVTGAAALFGGVIGAFVVGAVQDRLAKRHSETAPQTESMREALQKAIGLVVIKREDIKSITYGRWKGLTIETTCMKYNLIQMSKQQFAEHEDKIQAYLNGEDDNKTNG